MSAVDRGRPEAPVDTSMRSVMTVAVVVVAAVAGYGGFRLAAGLDLGAQAGAGMVALAAVTGFAVFFSPCSFPLVVGLLAGPDPAERARLRIRDSVATALAMGAGAAVFLLILGVVVGVAGEGIARSVSFDTVGGRLLRAAVAGVLVTAGLVQLGKIRFPLGRVTGLAKPIDRRRAAVAQSHRYRAHMLYGFGFILAGFG